MNYFDTVKERVADYIVEEPIEETAEVISAYTLVSALKDANKRLRHVKEKEKYLLDELNDIYPSKKSKKRLFKKSKKLDYFDRITQYIYDDCTELSLRSNIFYDGVDLYKDFYYTDIYSKEGHKLSEEAYEETIDDISDILDELNYFGLLFTLDREADKYNRKLVNTLSYEGFNLKVEFYRGDWFANPSFIYSIGLNHEFDPNGHMNAHFYGKENNLDKLIEDNEEAILRNMPIKLSDLSYMFCMLVLDYKTKKERKESAKQAQKVLSEIKMNED